MKDGDTMISRSSRGSIVAAAAAAAMLLAVAAPASAQYGYGGGGGGGYGGPPPGGGYDRPPPPGHGGGGGGGARGSFRRTCQNIREDGPIVSADCPTVRGDYRQTSIDIRSCGRGRLGNNNGRLFCE